MRWLHHFSTWFSASIISAMYFNDDYFNAWSTLILWVMHFNHNICCMHFIELWPRLSFIFNTCYFFITVWQPQLTPLFLQNRDIKRWISVDLIRLSKPRSMPLLNKRLLVIRRLFFLLTWWMFFADICFF